MHLKFPVLRYLVHDPIIMINFLLTLVLLTTVMAINIGHLPTIPHISHTPRAVDNTTDVNNANIDKFLFHPRPVQCGEANLLLVGIPPYHPIVKAGGFDPKMIEAILANDTNLLVNSGYNVRMVLFGPEQPLSVLEAQFADIDCWDGTGVGFGERGTTDVGLTERFEDTIHYFRKRAPNGPIMFNSSPTTFLPTLKRHFPIAGGADCAKEGKPGKLLGFRVICDDGVCKKD
ncbi:hypothetical protein QC763_605080 [Podospora pseudopauciseta]|uniref:Uncharacterized protein n=1 Tax=Podospora pseudopauciseta TaxID=2093780 RepID=A0ABR0H3N4_9PEZI|nr:hypothetical protein QC763_605080 [Podospora pseudopauciseta]